MIVVHFASQHRNVQLIENAYLTGYLRWTYNVLGILVRRSIGLGLCFVCNIFTKYTA
jgi:hypothetical protein